MVLRFKVIEIQKREKPRLRWADSVESDFGIINGKTWRTKVNKSNKTALVDGSRNFEPPESDEDDICAVTTLSLLNIPSPQLENIEPWQI
ncbi:hypothetical protein TNCV_1943991 [Trichonephila clavipes]|nr:hypothetical protein TNCV_1943991 [Trichonephila clavipes]